MNVDLACSIGILALAAAAGSAYAARVRRVGAARYARLEDAGASTRVAKGALTAGYWSLHAVARALVRLGVTANQVTLLSLIAGVAAAVAAALGHFGVAGALTVLATVADAMDGIVARERGTASDAGEVFDAAADRYQETLFLAGVCVALRDRPGALVAALLAMLACFMVSYGTAKAEALGVQPPKSAMRRPVRAVYMAAGVVFVPIVSAVGVRFGLGRTFGIAPLLAALGVIAVVGNVSAARRLAAIASAVKARRARPSPPKAQQSSEAPPSRGRVTTSTGA